MKFPVSCALAGVLAALLAAPVAAAPAPAPAPKAAAPTPAATPAPAANSVVARLATANAKTGEVIAQRCHSCHDWTRGGLDGLGPNLWGIVGRKRASSDGFGYSRAMKAKGGVWTYDELFTYLRNPAAYIPGNKMSFTGLPKDQDRLDIIAFLRTKADTPAPLK